jgi:hypothetical protein
MDFMLLLLGIVLVAVICAAQRIVTRRKQPPARQDTRRPMSPPNSTATARPSLKGKRQLRSISIEECETLIHESDGVLFVSINDTGQRGPVPFHNMYALAMTPRQFANEVRWFPSHTCVVLCGDVNLCSSVLLGLLENVPEIPPIYMLRDRSSQWEVA